MDKDGWIKKMWYIHHGALFTFKQEESLVISDNMYDSTGYYIKWNNSGTGRQIPHNLTHLLSLKFELMEVERESGLSGIVPGMVEEMLVKAYNISFKWDVSRDWLYNLVTIISKDVLFWKCWEILSVLTTPK